MNALANPELKAAGRASLSQPPVIVLNMFHTGLGIARQLWNTGVRVVGLSAHRRSFGNFTRLCEVRLAPNSQDNPEQLLEFFFQIAKELEGAVIFPTRDADIVFLDRFRTELEPFYKVAIPPRQVLRRVMDKSTVSKAAVEAGIPVPRTTVLSDNAQLDRAIQTVGLPCVLKPTSSVHWRQGSNWNRVGASKAFRADTIEELLQLYERVRPVHSEVLLQEWIPGADDQLAIWGGCVGNQGSPLAYFTARKIVQSPPHFGTGCVVETDFLPELHGPSLDLCRTLDYSGIAEVEYKLDSRDGHFKLIEINPRHWDWHELGRTCSVNLTWSAYCLLTGSSTRPMAPSLRRTQWIAEDALLMNAISSVRRGNFHWLRPLVSMAGRQTFSIFSWRDPMPLVRYFMSTVLPKIVGAAFNKLRLFGRGIPPDEGVVQLTRPRSARVQSNIDGGITR